MVVEVVVVVVLMVVAVSFFDFVSLVSPMEASLTEGHCFLKGACCIRVASGYAVMKSM